jgi:hypothetical protein
LETKTVIKRGKITALPMPDRVIKRVISLGKKAKQTRTKQRVQFLNRNKEKFDWDNDELDLSPDLVDPTPHETDVLPAELPGVLLESDYADHNAVQAPPQPDLAAQAAATLANANLLPTNGPEIAGVNSDEAAVVSDDEGDDDEGDDDDVQFMGENLD